MSLLLKAVENRKQSAGRRHYYHNDTEYDKRNYDDAEVRSCETSSVDVRARNGMDYQKDKSDDGDGVQYL